MNDIKQYKFDVFAGNIFSLFLILNATNLLVKLGFSTFDFLRENITLILGIIYLLYLFFNFNIVKTAVPNMIIFESVCIILLGLSVLRYPEASVPIIRRCIWTIAFCIPLFCIGRRVRDHDLFFLQAKYGYKMYF